ncbi:MAG: AAA family ATPase [Peptococcaceae bacterium]|nr:MAG: AAA family ATPase [Peptococcaceae bacterium]
MRYTGPGERGPIGSGGRISRSNKQEDRETAMDERELAEMEAIINRMGREWPAERKAALTQKLRELNANTVSPQAQAAWPNGLPGSSNTVLSLRQPNACLTCGFPANEPGYINIDPGGNTISKIKPCPDCNAQKLAHRAKFQTQLEGDLKLKTFANYSISPHNQAAYNAAIEFCRYPRHWLTLWGEYGPGKTHLLAAIVNQLAGQANAKYFTMPDLVSQYRNSVGMGVVEEFYERISRIGILVIDEIDKADLKGWTREQTYRLFDYRYRNQDTLGTVLAMNVSPDVIDDDLSYLFSRMKDSHCRVVYLGGGDNRPNRDTLQQFAEIQ